MITKLDFDGKMVGRAKQKAEALGSANNSITNGVGNLAGYLGEEAAALHLGAEIVSCDEGKDKYNHDLLYKGIKLEVKTFRRGCKPIPKYNALVNGISIHQKPDIYVFTSMQGGPIIQKNPTIYKGVRNMWLCGFMGRDEFFHKARFFKAGQRDGNHVYKEDAYVVFIRELHNDIESCKTF